MSWMLGNGRPHSTSGHFRSVFSDERGHESAKGEHHSLGRFLLSHRQWQANHPLRRTHSHMLGLSGAGKGFTQGDSNDITSMPIL